MSSIRDPAERSKLWTIMAEIVYYIREEICMSNLNMMFFHLYFDKFLKTKFFYNKGQSVRPKQLGLFVNLDRLELTYRAQTFRDHSFRN